MLRNKIITKLLIASAICLQAIGCWPEFYLFTKENIQDPSKINPRTIHISEFDFAKKTVLLVHGFGDNGVDSILLKIKDELLINNDVNLISVDWKDGAAPPNYPKAASNTRLTARGIADFLKSSGIDQTQVHCIGHSLGAHVCGFAGNITQFKRISGIDPAGPKFAGEKEDRLKKSDAEFVDVIHTDGVYGTKFSMGHQDFYPNGGEFQNGCNLFDQFGRKKREDSQTYRIVQQVACSHFRGILFYAESINSNCKFTSVPCENYDKFRKLKCSYIQEKPCALMGYFANPEERGDFFLDTNKKSPFCLS